MRATLQQPSTPAHTRRWRDLLATAHDAHCSGQQLEQYQLAEVAERSHCWANAASANVGRVT